MLQHTIDKLMINRSDEHHEFDNQKAITQELATHFQQLSHGHLLPLHLWQLLSRCSSTCEMIALFTLLFLNHLSCDVWNLAIIVRGTIFKSDFRAFPLGTRNFACNTSRAYDVNLVLEIASASPSCKLKLMTCDNNASEYSQNHELPCRLDALHISFGKEATWVQLHWSLLGGLQTWLPQDPPARQYRKQPFQQCRTLRQTHAS